MKEYSRLTLRSIKCSELNERWVMDGIYLESFNLITGKNSSGKTRTLNVISNLAKIIDSKIMVRSGHWDALFIDEKGSEWKYCLNVADGVVLNEKYECKGDKVYLDLSGGTGQIFALELGKNIAIQSPNNKIAVSSREDSIQHPFFSPLINWAKMLYRYHFGTMMGKDHLLFINDKFPVPDVKNVN